MTDEPDEQRPDDATDARTMDDVDHTHPHTDAPFGENGVYDRGPDDDTGDADGDGSDDDGGRRRAAVGREDPDERDPVRTDGGSVASDPQPVWAVHDLADGDR